jgi:hypothetical protein
MKPFKPFFILVKNIRIELIELTKTPVLRAALFLPIIIIGIMSILFLFYFQKLPPLVPLYYSRPWGEEQLAPKIMLLLLPGGCFLWYLLSALFIHFATKEYRVFSQLILIVQAVVCIMAILTELNIIQLII